MCNVFVVKVLHTPLHSALSSKCVAFIHSGLELTHQGTIVKVNSLVVKGVVALGSVPSHAGKVRINIFFWSFFSAL